MNIRGPYCPAPALSLPCIALHCPALPLLSCFPPQGQRSLLPCSALPVYVLPCIKGHFPALLLYTVLQCSALPCMEDSGVQGNALQYRAGHIQAGHCRAIGPEHVYRIYSKILEYF